MDKFIFISLLFLVKYSQCCDCNLKKGQVTPITGKKRLIRLNSKPIVDKRQLPDSEYDMSGDFLETATNAVEESSPRIKKGHSGLHEIHFEVNKTQFSPSADDVLLRICPFYKPGPALNIEKMVDVWRLAFFRSATELGCFKILLKNLGHEAKEYFADKFGDFNKTIIWNDCVLQLTNGRVLPVQEQTHVLQKIGNYSGLLANIIVTEEIKSSENITLITLQDHSPDQWMITNNLLLMRDCDNGDVVVFSRVPFEPTQSDINEALGQFGEESKEGVWACRGHNQAILANPRYKILS